jgi:hypothetical protein
VRRFLEVPGTGLMSSRALTDLSFDRADDRVNNRGLATHHSEWL